MAVCGEEPRLPEGERRTTKKPRSRVSEKCAVRCLELTPRRPLKGVFGEEQCAAAAATLVRKEVERETGERTGNSADPFSPRWIGKY